MKVNKTKTITITTRHNQVKIEKDWMKPLRAHTATLGPLLDILGGLISSWHLADVKIIKHFENFENLMRFGQLVGRDQRNCGNREDLVMMVMDGADGEIRMVIMN